MGGPSLDKGNCPVCGMQFVLMGGLLREHVDFATRNRCPGSGQQAKQQEEL